MAVREKRKPQPDYVLSIPKRVPDDSDIRFEIHRFPDHLLFDLKIDGEIEHTSRHVVYDRYAQSLEDNAMAYVRYHTNESPVLTDGEIDQIEHWQSSDRGGETTPT